MKKLIVFILAFFLLSTIFVGCETKNQKATAKEPVKIEFFQMKREVLEVVDEIIKRFNKENPNIVIEQNCVPDPVEVLQTRVASGDIPELFNNWHRDVFNEMCRQGSVLDLTGQSFLNNVQPDLLKEVQVDGKDYCVPISVGTYGVFYNKKIFSELGLTVPKTYAEFIDTCEKIKAAGKIPLIYADKDPGACGWSAIHWTLDSVYRKYMEDITSGKALENMDFKRVGEKVVELRKYVQPDSLGTGDDQALADFANGKGAMYIQGTWDIAPFRKANPDLEFSMFPIPADKAEDTKCKVLVGDMKMSVAAKAKHMEEAKKFVAFFTKPEIATYFSEQDGSPSCIKGATADLKYIKEQNEAIAAGKVECNFDSDWPPSLFNDYGQIVQQLIIDKNVDTWFNESPKVFEELAKGLSKK